MSFYQSLGRSSADAPDEGLANAKRLLADGGTAKGRVDRGSQLLHAKLAEEALAGSDIGDREAPVYIDAIELQVDVYLSYDGLPELAHDAVEAATERLGKSSAHDRYRLQLEIAKRRIRESDGEAPDIIRELFLELVRTKKSKPGFDPDSSAEGILDACTRIMSCAHRVGDNQSLTTGLAAWRRVMQELAPHQGAWNQERMARFNRWSGMFLSGCVDRWPSFSGPEDLRLAALDHLHRFETYVRRFPTRRNQIIGSFAFAESLILEPDSRRDGIDILGRALERHRHQLAGKMAAALEIASRRGLVSPNGPA